MHLPKPALVILAVVIIVAASMIDSPTATATSLGIGLVIVAAIVSKMAAQDVEFLFSGDHLLSVVTITDAPGDLTWKLNPSKADNLFRSKTARWCATTAGIAVAWAVILGSYAVGIFYTKLSAVLAGYVVTFILLVVRVTLLPKFQVRVQKHHSRALEERMHEMLPALDTATQEIRQLRAVQNDINIFHRDLGLPQHSSFVTKAVSAIASSGRMAMDNRAVFTTAIRAVLSEAEEERGHLARTSDSYASVTSRLAQVRRSIDMLGVSSLSHRIDDLSHMLASDELKGLVEQGQWHEFSEVIALLVTDLDTLERQMHGFAGGDADRDEPPPPENGAVPVDWAYGVLNLSPTATKAEITRAFRTLCTKWHPDTGRVTDDTEIKRITEAYHVLKKAKRVA